MEKKETPQRNLRRFFVVGREPEKVTFRFAKRNASFNFSGTFRFADYSTEEAIGSAVDLWTSFREGQFPNQQAPWIGWLMVVGRDDASERPVKNYEPYFPVRPEFNNASDLDRYRILCQKLILERYYTSTALLWTSDANTYGGLAPDISVQSFINSFTGYLNGVENEFK